MRDAPWMNERGQPGGVCPYPGELAEADMQLEDE